MKRLLEKIKSPIWLVPLSFIALSGFTKIVDWGKENFKQASRHGQQFVKSAQPFIKNLKVYNQFTVVATFDVMLLSDPMRMLYVDYFKKDHAMSRDQEAMLRQRQLNENRYFISMYVVGTQKEHAYLTNKSLFTGEYQKATDMLKGTDAMWNVSMVVGGRQYAPESIRIVELPVEYRQCFGSDFSQFSTSYLVRFAAVDGQGNYIFSPNRQSSVVVRFSSPLYQADATWKPLQFYIK